MEGAKFASAQNRCHPWLVRSQFERPNQFITIDISSTFIHIYRLLCLVSSSQLLLRCDYASIPSGILASSHHPNLDSSILLLLLCISYPSTCHRCHPTRASNTGKPHYALTLPAICGNKIYLANYLPKPLYCWYDFFTIDWKSKTISATKIQDLCKGLFGYHRLSFSYINFRPRYQTDGLKMNYFFSILVDKCGLIWTKRCLYPLYSPLLVLYSNNTRPNINHLNFR